MSPLAILPFAAASVAAALRILEVRKKRATVHGKVSETFTLRLFVLAEAAMLIGSIVEYILRGYPFSWPLLLAGVVCSAFSFCLRHAAISALGRFWSLHVEIRENHELVRSGPFRWVRHPAYASMILEVTSFGLILHAFYMLLLIPVIFLPVVLIRLKTEETALLEKFGDAYREYQRSTPAILPLKTTKSK